MILLLLSAAVVLNLVGRFLILRHDGEINESWRRALTFCPGADLVYLLLRWERARVGCLVCGLSLAIALPVAGQALGLVQLTNSGNHPGTAQPLAASKQPPRGDLEKARRFKEEKVAKLNHYLTNWYQQIRTLEDYLCDEMPTETREFDQQVVAYQTLYRVWKTEQSELDRLKALN